MYGNNPDYGYGGYDPRAPPTYDQMDMPLSGNMPPNAAYGNAQTPGPRPNIQPAPPYYNTNPNFQNQFPNADQYVFDPVMANVAMQYGSKLVGSGKDIVDKKISQYVALNSLKYYFSVDTQYVLKKLSLLFFPFMNKEWSMKYVNNEPLPPRQQVNAPDLYIPLMTYVTYVLAVGVLLGIKDKFSPEVLGVISSQALAWVVLELLIHSVTLYVSNIDTRLKLMDLLAFIGYKFFAVIFCIFLGFLFGKTGFYVGWLYSSAAMGFFMMRAMKSHVLYFQEDFQENVDFNSSVHYKTGTKRRLYFLFFCGIAQPILIWCLSYQILGLIS